MNTNDPEYFEKYNSVYWTNEFFEKIEQLPLDDSAKNMLVRIIGEINISSYREGVNTVTRYVISQSDRNRVKK